MLLASAGAIVLLNPPLNFAGVSTAGMQRGEVGRFFKACRDVLHVGAVGAELPVEPWLGVAAGWPAIAGRWSWTGLMMMMMMMMMMMGRSASNTCRHAPATACLSLAFHCRGNAVQQLSFVPHRSVLRQRPHPCRRTGSPPPVSARRCALPSPAAHARRADQARVAQQRK